MCVCLIETLLIRAPDALFILALLKRVIFSFKPYLFKPYSFKPYLSKPYLSVGLLIS